MKLQLSHLISWKGEIDRRVYLIWGIILFAIKYNLDRLTALALHRTWFITDYFIQADQLSVGELSAEAREFYLILLAQSLVFIWFGTVLCVKRLRSAKLPTWFVLFFFLPFINFILFILLSALPERGKGPMVSDSYLQQLIPKSKYGSAFFAIGAVLLISLLLTALLVNYLQEYGWSMFVGIPFFLGFGSVLIYGYQRTLRYREALGVAMFSVLFFGLIIFLFAMEGILCIVMAFPIFAFIAMIGASVGYAIHASNQPVALNAFIIPLLMVPAAGVIEHQVTPTPPTILVTSSVIIHASKQDVWNQLVAFSKIDEPTELLFKTGIAYPTHAEIDRTGVGAIRKCNFTTGCFIEPITIWDEPNVLEFGVLDQPPPMIEWSVYDNLQLAHLDGYFRSVKGQFKLVSLPNGQTELLGTTWYYHDVWPSFYWKLWSDYILHRIHLRVLNHIKKEAEVK